MSLSRLCASFLAVLMVLLPVSPVQAQSCQEIRFERGAFSGVVQGMAPANSALCYTIGTGSNQQMRISITGRNTMFSIVGVVDAQTDYIMTTRSGTYQILVGQLFRAVSDEPFTMTVTIR